MDERTAKLKARVDELMDWMRQDMQQQITIDNYGPRSQKIVAIDKLVTQGKDIDSLSLSFDSSLVLIIDGKEYLVPAVQQ